jgi:hypothetical protein
MVVMADEGRGLPFYVENGALALFGDRFRFDLDEDWELTQQFEQWADRSFQCYDVAAWSLWGRATMPIGFGDGVTTSLDRLFLPGGTVSAERRTSFEASLGSGIAKDCLSTAMTLILPSSCPVSGSASLCDLDSTVEVESCFLGSPLFGASLLFVRHQLPLASRHATGILANCGDTIMPKSLPPLLSSRLRELSGKTILDGGRYFLADAHRFLPWIMCGPFDFCGSG